MKTVDGDLIKLAEAGEFDVIIHGCNCFGKMGAGIAKAIRSSFPEAAAADQKTPKGDRTKLGTISIAEIHRNGHRLTVINAYTQFHWQGPGRLVDYNAIRSVMQTVKIDYSGQRIAYPRIGAGLARGNWEVIKKIITKELKHENHTLVNYSP